MEQITEDYCSYEVSKLLNEKGFSENTICKYAGVGGTTEKWYDDYRERVVRFDWIEGHLIEPLTEPKDQYETIGNTIPAPTHQMALKWLRKAYDIIIIPYPTITDDDGECGCLWGYTILKRLDSIHQNDDVYYDPEDTVEEALLYALKNLI